MSASPLLSAVVAELQHSAPLALAESWDNVGLLLEPQEGDPPCRRLLLTIDLDGPVLEEARCREVDLVVAYHPVIFGGLKRLRAATPRERLVIEALRSHLAVYSPHTALDAVAGGMTDWLASALGPGDRRAILPARPREEAPGAPEGQGRVVSLDKPVALDRAVAAIKEHLGLGQVRVAAAARHQKGELIRSLAVCPGAGGSVLEKLDSVDLLLTGEMRHHDVLARRAQGCSVVLCDHSNTERGFLPIYAERLRERLPGVEVLVSREDRDPLSIL